MSLSSMYMDTPTAEISGTIANLRKEEADRKSRNWKSAQDLLRGAAVDSIRSKYADQIDWNQGVQNADKVFKVQYERLMAVDPAAAQQLREDYLAERTKRVNHEIADKYQGATSKVNADIKAIEQEIMQLESEIQGEELQAQQAAQDEVDRKAAEEAQLLSNEQARKDSTQQMQGYRPNTPDQQPPVAPVSTEQATAGLRSFYGTYPEPAPQQALPEPRSGMQTQQESPEASSMRGYRPLKAWYGGMK